MTIAPLIRKLERLGPLPDQGRRALQGLPVDAKPVGADWELLRDGEPTQHCWLLLDGMACCCKTPADGRRRIVSLHVPGDLLGLSGLLLGEMDHAVTTLTPAVVAPIAHATVLGWMEGASCSGLGRLLWRDAMIEAAMLRAWLVNVGHCSAPRRTAHLLCEVALRLRAVGLAWGEVYPLALSQTKLAAALGLSCVHTNRVIQTLRGEGLIEFGGGSLVVLDWEGLTRAAGFDPRYLHRLGTTGRGRGRAGDGDGATGDARGRCVPQRPLRRRTRPPAQSKPQAAKSIK